MRRPLAFLAALMILASASFAFEVSIQPKELNVRAGGNATFDLIIASGINDTLVVSPKGEQPWVTTPTTVNVQAGIPKVEVVSIQPYPNSKPSIYFVEYGLESVATGEKKFTNLTVIIRVADITIEKVDIKGIIEPAGFGEASFFVNSLENASATAVLKTTVGNRAGTLKFHEQDEFLSFEPLEFKIVKQRFDLPECLPADEYVVRSRLSSKGSDVFYTEDKFTVPDKFIVKTVRQEKAGLRTDVAIEVKNVGNIPGVATVRENVWGSIFFSGDQPSDTKDGFVWEVALGSCESKTIRYSIDYAPLLVLILLAFALWYVFFRMHTVHIKKVVLQRRSIEKGIEFTIGNSIKSFVKVKDVEVRDFVPALFEVTETPGIKPVRHKTAAGTELIWRLGTLYPYEERVLAYKIKPAISITGHVDLPRSSVTFVYIGRRIHKRSSAAAIGIHFPKGNIVYEISARQAREGMGKIRNVPLRFRTSGIPSDITYIQDRLGKKVSEKAAKAKEGLKGFLEKPYGRQPGEPAARKDEQKKPPEDKDEKHGPDAAGGTD